MSLWNPLSVFSHSERPTGGSKPASSFDPSRTGDPVGPGYETPSIGYGDSWGGTPAGYAQPRRRPIGFAPPEEGVEPRYRTELSFKRHHEMPRASAGSGEGGDTAGEPWLTPDTGRLDPSYEPAGDDALAETPPTPDKAPAAPEKVPFLKREISFRRKHAVPDEPVSVHEDDTLAAEDRAEVPAADDLLGGSGPLASAAGDATPEAQAAAEVPAEDAHVVEFPDIAAVDTAAEAAGAPILEATPGGEKVPFYKREISFRRKSSQQGEPAPLDVPSISEPEEPLLSWDVPVAPAAPEDVVVEPAIDAFPFPNAVSRPHADQGEGDVAESVAAEAVDETDLFAHEPDMGSAPEPSFSEAPSEAYRSHDLEAELEETEDQDHLAAGGVESVGDADPARESVSPPEAHEDDDLPPAASDDDGATSSDESPARSGRFSRKDKGAPKSPMRKQARGGKGGKGGKGRRVVGLKIGASQIAAAVVVESNGASELVELARRPLAAGIVVDGEVRDVDALSHAVKAFFDEEHLPKKDVRIGLASNRIGVRTFDIVGIEDEVKFDNAVRFKAHEVLPVAAHESVLDYRVLEERPNEAGEPFRRVLLVVAPRDQVEPYVEVAQRAGIKLSSIDLEALGLLRAFVEPRPFAVRAVDDTATVVVSIGHESSTLLVAGGGACEFTRVFDWGGNALEEAIATALDVHPAEAATILRHLSLSGPGRQFDALDEASRAKALDAVRLRLTPFARELVSSLQFYQTQPESLGIGGILITGGTSHLEGLSEALHQMIGVNVSVGDPLGRVTHAGELDPAVEAQIGSMAVPIGLAVDDLGLRSVDLLPKDAVATKSRRQSLVTIGLPIAAAVPLVALGALYVGAHGTVTKKQSELSALTTEIAALPKPTGPQIDPSIAGNEAVRATAVASVLGGRLAWDGVFGDLSRVLPANVWLKSLSASLPDASVATGIPTPTAAPVPGQAASVPSSVQIDGYTYSQPDVAYLLARLATLPSLARVTLTSSTEEIVSSKPVFHFTIVADLSQPGGAS